MLCALVTLLDGYDLQAMASATPALAADWGVAPDSLRWVITAALIGVAVAALLLILSPTVRAHLHLLSRLAFALQQPGFREAVMEQATRQRILGEARRCDELASEARTTPSPAT